MKVTYDFSVEAIRFEFKREYYDSDKRKEVFKENGLAAMLKFRQEVVLSGMTYIEYSAPEPEKNPFPESFEVIGGLKNLAYFKWTPQPKSIKDVVESFMKMKGVGILELYSFRGYHDIHQGVNIPKSD
jgi:hypothetical protein